MRPIDGISRDRLKAISGLLCCPLCRGPLSEQAVGDTIEALLCRKCDGVYSCAGGVPDFSMTVVDRATQRGFSYQWKKRSEGAFEKGTIYGRSIAGRAADVSDLFDPQHAPAVILDAGCGAGDIALELANRYPHATVIALDYSTSVFHIAGRPDLPSNVVVIRGDIKRLPLADRSIDLVYSLGVMHHTDSTKNSFDAVARVVRTDGRMILWLYPVADEVPFYSLYYRIRDRHFAGIGHRLPNGLRAMLVYGYTWLMYPYLRFGKYRGFFSGDPSGVRVREFVGSAALIIFDDVTPRFQFRHPEGEVLGWYRENGFVDQILDKPKLLYVGIKAG